MNPSLGSFKKLIIPASIALLLAACAAPLTKPQGAIDARNRLTQLQTDPQLGSRAQVEVAEAETAVRAAEVPNADPELTKHLVVMAERKVDIAQSKAQNRYFEDQRKTLGEQRETARLESRTREADRARSEAKSARSEARSARSDASAARTDAEVARADAELARGQADSAVIVTEAAMMAAADAQQESNELRQQLDELNARPTERGMVVTLGDVLFDTGKARLKGGDPVHLAKLATFLNKNRDRSVIIEGHTDSVGGEKLNQTLSQRRADAVKTYLISRGVEARRLVAFGKGEGFPVGSNDSSSGRQQNRRVEVIIANTITVSRSSKP